MSADTRSEHFSSVNPYPHPLFELRAQAVLGRRLRLAPRRDLTRRPVIVPIPRLGLVPIATPTGIVTDRLDEGLALGAQRKRVSRHSNLWDQDHCPFEQPLI